jgi:NTP pyrophosphatase (non-canonical NTP hydrolase)
MAMCIELRPEVQKFAEAMELKLRQNDHKGGWKGENESWLMLRAHEELSEMFRVMEKRKVYDVNLCYLPSTVHREMILSECADVSNFCMMIADICGALP